MKKLIVPPIKSQGIKTKLVSWIKSIIPDDYNDVWIEPFMGTGVVAFNINPKKAILSDTNPHLINFYKAVQKKEITPNKVKIFLNNEGNLLLEKGEEHYYKIRERFNKSHDPMDFLFLNRSCFNGMIRFNKNGGFNVPFCRKPQRFAKAYITKIINQVEYVDYIISSNDYEFICQDFKLAIKAASKNNIIYCDPPYIDRHTDYFNSWDGNHEEKLYASLSETESYFILSTWHHNDYRENQYIKLLWDKFQILTKEHYYHVGAKENNRNAMIEALITNFTPKLKIENEKDDYQYSLI